MTITLGMILGGIIGVLMENMVEDAWRTKWEFWVISLLVSVAVVYGNVVIY